MPKHMKKGVKVIGIACSSFNREKDNTVPVIGVIYRGAQLFEGLMVSSVTVDGEDATNNIIEMITESAHYEQLKAILTRGVTIAGFNYIDLAKLSQQTSLPTISIVDHQPDMKKIENALANLPNGRQRFAIIKKNGPPKVIISNNREEPVYMQVVGFSEEEASQLIQNTTVTGRFPEPLRVARIIAIALKKCRGNGIK